MARAFLRGRDKNGAANGRAVKSHLGIQYLKAGMLVPS